jgi:hypothetical protein
MNKSKGFLPIALILLLLITSSFKPLTIDQLVTGKIFQVINKKRKPIAELRIFVIANKKTRIAETVTDKNGYYNIAFDTYNLPDKTRFDFFITKKGMDTLFLKSFTHFESDVVSRDFTLPRALKKSTNN